MSRNQQVIQNIRLTGGMLRDAGSMSIDWNDGEVMKQAELGLSEPRGELNFRDYQADKRGDNAK